VRQTCACKHVQAPDWRRNFDESSSEMQTSISLQEGPHRHSQGGKRWRTSCADRTARRQTVDGVCL